LLLSSGAGSRYRSIAAARADTAASVVLRAEVRGSTRKLQALPVWFQVHFADGSRRILYQQNPPVLNWRCQLTLVDLYKGGKTVVGWFHVRFHVQSFILTLRFPLCVYDCF